MNKVELINTLAEKTGYTKKDTKTFLETMQEVIYETLRKGEEVKLVDGVTLITKQNAETVRRNPKTGENVTVPAKTVPKAKFGKAIKDYLN